MLISDYRLERHGHTVRNCATIDWEDSDRPRTSLYFAVHPPFSDALTCDPHAFLVAALLPAMRHGEKRIRIQGSICPQLHDGLLNAMAWIRHWYGHRRGPVRIEADSTQRYPKPGATGHTASFLSGGIDSLATLVHNRAVFPPGHPNVIQSCLCVHGFDIGGQAGGDGQYDYFDRSVRALSHIAAEANVDLIPVYTNARHLDDDFDFWVREFHGAALASVAHALSAKLTAALIASSDGINDPIPWGSHPALDYNYGSADLRVVHDGIRFSRFDKLKMISHWEPAVRFLRVCTHNPSGSLNCGTCFKCVLTMTQLLVVGKLSRSDSFPAENVSAAMIERLRFTKGYQVLFFGELIEPLTALGRHDLVRVIVRKTKQYRLFFKLPDTLHIDRVVRSLDRRWLNGRFTALARRLSRAKS